MPEPISFGITSFQPTPEAIRSFQTHQACNYIFPDHSSIYNVIPDITVLELLISRPLPVAEIYFQTLIFTLPGHYISIKSFHTRFQERGSRPNNDKKIAGKCNSRPVYEREMSQTIYVTEMSIQTNYVTELSFQ